ncbi:MAG: methyltransferase domain-containing protein [Acidobacteria bacterium]|nr:methyltransferase domain-containing protein [Acidobacteriota bacterium]
MERMLAATLRAEDTHFWFRALRRQAQRLLDDARASATLTRIVDCGAGTGRNLDWLRRYAPAIGIERSWFGLSAGRARGRSMIGGSVAALPLSDGCADLVTSFDVLYCLDDETERRAIAEMWRVLRPGGIALLNVAALDVLRGSHSALTHERRRYTKTRLSRRLTAAGFRVERLTYTNCVLFPAALATRSLERLTGRAAAPSESDLTVPSRPINWLLDRLLAAEAAWLRVADLPVGTSIMAVARKP